MFTRSTAKSASVVGAMLIAALAVAPAQALAKPHSQQQDSESRVFSEFILGSLCKEGLPDHVNQSCTMPDGSVWTCIPAPLGGFECTKEGAAGSTVPGRFGSVESTGDLPVWSVATR